LWPDAAVEAACAHVSCHVLYYTHRNLSSHNLLCGDAAAALLQKLTALTQLQIQNAYVQNVNALAPALPQLKGLQRL
jgi:hypothetical protein